MNAPLGAEVRCGDLRAATDGQIAAIRAAWLEHLVVLFRGQQFTDADLIAFARRFGEFQYSTPLPSPLANEGKAKQGGADERYPEITVVSNVVEDGVALGGLGDGELIWHTDMSSFDAPPNQTILHAIEVPAEKGRTGFDNMYLACDALPAALRERVDGLMLKHDATIDAAGYVRKRFADAPVDVRESPGAAHPLICTHPETGRNCLYLGRRAKAYLVGLPIAESEALLDELVGARYAAAVHLAPRLAGRRRADVGQPLRDAPPGSVRPAGAAHSAPGGDQGQPTSPCAGCAAAASARPTTERARP